VGFAKPLAWRSTDSKAALLCSFLARSIKSQHTRADRLGVEKAVSSQPCIKGTVLQLAVEAVRRLRGAGLIERRQLEARLRAEDLALLDGEVLPAVWYPIATLSRILEITTYGDVTGGGLEAVVDVGVRAAKRLFASQIYKDYMTKAEGGWGPREAGAALVRVTPLLCNFTRWTYHADPEPSDTFRIEVQNATQFSDLLRFIAQGCIQYLAERVNRRPVRVTSTRPTPDQIVYLGNRGVSA
jgi:hypothetical protein